MRAWGLTHLPDLSGKKAVVTGATSGIGFETAKVLAQRGAEVWLACRDPIKARLAAERLETQGAALPIRVVALDLASLQSVRECAESLRRQLPRLDLLINNAGVMVPPYSLTREGFELQFGTNHLGHFALTGQLISLLRTTRNARIVTVSSVVHHFGTMNFDDLHWQRGYHPVRAYAQSKLANLLFTYELQRRLQTAGSETLAVAAHPGWARTELLRHVQSNVLVGWLFKLAQRFLSQDARGGALPGLRAAADPRVAPGDFYGPDGFLQSKGAPVRVNSSTASRNRAWQQRLWQISEELTGVRYLD
ncbi:MAG: SDR family oxidoreductase [Candidatus Eremiobacteraeota bacterium]|nr:SDR family oxidoreductase [Candidatus Eremiobacteraeota bacterium]MCW5867043.1 SDR family oxidoreductase [Candidatus Eremiobacteraeota bacterium]